MRTRYTTHALNCRPTIARTAPTRSAVDDGESLTDELMLADSRQQLGRLLRRRQGGVRPRTPMTNDDVFKSPTKFTFPTQPAPCATPLSTVNEMRAPPTMLRRSSRNTSSSIATPSIKERIVGDAPATTAQVKGKRAAFKNVDHADGLAPLTSLTSKLSLGDGCSCVLCEGATDSALLCSQARLLLEGENTLTLAQIQSLHKSFEKKSIQLAKEMAGLLSTLTYKFVDDTVTEVTVLHAWLDTRPTMYRRVMVDARSIDECRTV